MLTKRQHNYLNNLQTPLKPVSIYPWEEIGLEIAQSVIDEAPDLEVFLAGSIPLKIAGQRDIDLACESDFSNFKLIQGKLEKIWGKASKVSDDSMVWHFTRGGYEVSFYVINPKKSDQLKRQMAMNDIFRNNPKILAEYEKLKLSLNGVPYKKYLEKKFEFFNRIYLKG